MLAVLEFVQKNLPSMEVKPVCNSPPLLYPVVSIYGLTRQVVPWVNYRLRFCQVNAALITD